MFKRVFRLKANNGDISIFGEYTQTTDEGDCLGTGTMKIPYSDAIYKQVKPGFEDLKINGGIYDDGTIFGGRTSGVQVDDNIITVNLQDYGYKLKADYSLEFDSEDIRDIFKKIIKAASMIPILQGIRKEDVSKTQATTDTTATDPTAATTTDSTADPTASTDPTASADASAVAGDTSGTASTDKTGCISYTGAATCSDSAAHKKIGASGTFSWKNVCPITSCAKTGHLKQGCKGADEVTCCAGSGGCGADFCGVCGKEKYNRHGSDFASDWHLTPCDGTASASGSGAELKTYEDYLNFLCQDRQYNWFVTPNNEVMVVSWDNPDFADEPIPDWCIERGHFTEKINTTQTSNTIKVQYKGGTLLVQDKDMVALFGQKIGGVIKSKNSNIHQAHGLGMSALGLMLVDQDIEYDMTILGSHMYRTGKWVKFNNPKTGQYLEMFISSCKTTITPDANIRMDFKLKVAPKYIQSSSSGGSGAGGDPTSLDAIGKQEATYTDCQSPQVPASRLDANDKMGCSNCWGDSYWLYDKMTAAGFKCRIVCGDGGCHTGPGHRWMEYMDGGKWVPFPGYMDTGRKWGGWHHGPGKRTIDGILPHPTDGTGSGL